MRSILLSIFLVLAFVCPITTYGQTASSKVYKPKKIKLKGHQPDYELLVDSGYDPDLLIPHFNAMTQKWGYIHRTSKELVVDHQYKHAGLFHNGFAIAVDESRDSTRQNVYRIAPDGSKTILFFDDETYGEPKVEDNITIRFLDDFTYVLRCGIVNIYKPDGSLINGNAAPKYGQPFQYIGKGNMSIEYEKKILFWSMYFSPPLVFNKEQYHFLESSAYENKNRSRAFEYCKIVRVSDQKIGIIDYNGKFVNDFIWDLAPYVDRRGMTFSQVASDVLVRDYYDITEDGKFLAFRDGKTVLAHISGKILFDYPEGSTAYNPRYGFWKSQGLATMKIKGEDNQDYFILFDPKTGEEKLRSLGDFVFLDDNRVATRDTNVSVQQAPNFHFFEAPSFQRIPCPYTNENWIPFQTIKYENHYYWLIWDLDASVGTIVNEEGDMLIPAKYKSLHYFDYEENKYPVVFGYTGSGKTFTVYKFTPNGTMLFGPILFSANTEPEVADSYFAYVNSSEFGIIPSLSNDDEFYPNRLEFVSQFTKTGEKLGSGYIDIYGQVYF